MGDRKHSLLLALLQGSVRSGTTGEAEQEGGHIQLSPVQPSTITTPGYFPSRIPQSPPWPVRAPALPKICCSLTPKPGHQRSQTTGAVKSQVPLGTVPHDRGVPAPLGYCKKDLGSCCSHLGWICLEMTRAGEGNVLSCWISAPKWTASCATAAA